MLFQVRKDGKESSDNYLKKNYGLTDAEINDIGGWTQMSVASHLLHFISGVEKLPKHVGVTFRRTKMLSPENRAQYMPDFKPGGEVDAGYLNRYQGDSNPGKQNIAISTSPGELDLPEKVGDWVFAFESKAARDITNFNGLGEREAVFTNLVSGNLMYIKPLVK